jgi:hypothetical protein
MKLTLKQLVESLSAVPGKTAALQQFAEDDRLPIKTSYWAGKVLKKALKEIGEYQEARRKIFDTVGATAIEGTDRLKLEPGQIAPFNAAHDELLSAEIELPGNTFTLEQLGTAQFSPAVMMTLDWLITE